MAKFLEGDHLNSELINILEQAHEQLVIISPFIKLHPRIKDKLKNKLTEANLAITIVFGKNEDNKSKSLSLEEFEFLKAFPNIEIKYEPRLHAKYYANESAAILSSMNLYDYSLNNNIEFGILTKNTIIGDLTGRIVGESLDYDAFTYFETVVNNSTLKFKNVPQYKQVNFGISKKYTHSEVELDLLSNELEFKKTKLKKEIKKTYAKNVESGYCIRTGVKIPFNPKKPLSDKAFESWNKFKDKTYSEKYCHFSGEKSNGETTFAKPILKKNWSKTKP
jgi:tRNA splicing endonuclease